ncbi:MAG: cell division protein FtsA [Prevotella sp.]|nr:cell division protein FtsA [Candidatus Prevotella equi]
MPAKNFVVAIELGSTKITGIAGQKKSDGSIAVHAVVREDATQCIRKGVVYNIDKTVQCITNIIQRLKGQMKCGVKHVYIGVGGQSIHSERNIITQELNGAMPVTQQLIVDMMDNNRGKNYPDMEILDVEAQEYRADSLLQTDPVGIQCTRLDGNFLNILQSKRHYQKLNTCFELAGVKLAEIYLAPFALADAVLTPVEKRSGTMLVDLGADTTTVMVYYKNIIRHVAVIPLGGNNITKDICSLQVEDNEAEVLKLRYASAYTPSEDIDPTLKYDLDRERKVESSRFIDIVEARVQEIVANVWNQVPAEFTDKLLGGIVLTGGGSNLKNIDVAFRKHTRIEKIRIAKFVTYTINTTNPEINAHDGTMNTILGLLAKGDQNCWAPIEETKAQDMFGNNGNTVATTNEQETKEPRDPNTLPPGAVLTEAEKKLLLEKQEKEKLEKEMEEKRLEAERLAAEEEARKKKEKSFGNKILKWLSSMTEEE